jgi:hypothetical protein
MSFAIFKGEKSVTELAARLFALQGKGAQPAAKQAGDLLLKANPQLKEISKVPVGSVILVPAEAPALKERASLAPGDVLRAFAAERAHQLVVSLDDRMAKIESLVREANSSILAQAKSKEARTASAKDPILKANLPVIIKSAESRSSDLKSSQSVRTKAIAELRTSLSHFLGK